MNYSFKDDRGYNQIFKPSYSTNRRLERRSDYIISQFASLPTINILEIGCGMGIMANMLATKTTANVLGVDLCQPFIESAKKKFNHPNLSFESMDFTKPEEFLHRRFNYIVGNGILHHLYYNLDDALLNIKNLLKTGWKNYFFGAQYLQSILFPNI